jgi:23S rRNA (adenine2503-C2)-methyltransferase
MKRSLKQFRFDELAAIMQEWGEKPFRARQIWSWLYAKPVRSFDEMTTLSLQMRKRLQDSFRLNSLKPVKKTQSGSSRTTKFLWECEDGSRIESVYIPDGKRRTFCISSQVGCALGCGICATGKLGWKRNLNTGEITDQVVRMIQELEIQPSNLVFMGMGEPLLNYDTVINALGIINHSDGLAVGHRKITVSTAGIIPGIKRFTQEKQPYKLAVSLNATTEKQRSMIMPINKKYPMHELLSAIRQYTQSSKHRVTFEYVLIRNFNDSPQDADRLSRLLANIPCKINLIALNPTGDRYRPPDETVIEAFAERLRPMRAPVTLRMSRGDDIQGACGQLAADSSPERENGR